MTKQTNSNATKPTHRLYRVEGTGKSAKWTEIGAAWPNKDGEGFSITCGAVPLQGRIVMRKVKARAPKQEAA
ncbi:hypothetical protein PIB19_05955 [Sphingomonas sp. 7/4-4]|uniref:hypothetical protein n=1 Tax=Sphingomonas sp. 7/4-4 TaxID=3018446 RepID=UPI0022F3CCE4|nr:hypothetical protein [Sphingomonas sp. 7/4-4]WBY08940.1 hypothetical protein PIB19_05955 [Sphingomonas sp. 7/4-4]